MSEKSNEDWSKTDQEVDFTTQKYSQRMSAEVRDLLTGMLRKDPL